MTGDRTFQITSTEAGFGSIAVEDDGSALRFRPTRSTRWHGPALLALGVVFALVGIAGAIDGNPLSASVPCAFGAIVAFIGARVMRVCVIVDRDRLVSRNVLVTRWVAGRSITSMRVEERGFGPLLSWSLDTNFRPAWVPLDVIVVEGGGQRIVADALRSDRRARLPDRPSETVAGVRAEVLTRWRSTYWVPDVPTDDSGPAPG